MLPESALTDALHREEITRKDRLLLILATSPDDPKSVGDIRDLAVASGLRAVRKWNLSSILGSAKSLVARVEEGWVLTTQGKRYLIDSSLLDELGNVPPPVLVDLRKHLADMSNAGTAAFLEEAIACFEHRLYRAAVVLSWIGAVSLLYDHVVDQHLDAFNKEARRRDTKWRTAKNTDDLSRMKEHDFLDVLESLSIIGKNVKQELQHLCLKLRNACGHPNSLKISQNRVSAHLEVLALNIFSQF